MPELEHVFAPTLPIPDFLVGEVQSKLAYVMKTYARRRSRQQATGSRSTCIGLLINQPFPSWRRRPNGLCSRWSKGRSN